MVITNAEQLHYPEELIDAALAFAESSAFGVAELLQNLGVSVEDASKLKPELLLDLGAWVQLIGLHLRAEASGLGTIDLPNLKEVEADLVNRIQNAPGSFATITGTTLSRRMFKFHMNNVAWAQPSVPNNAALQLYLMLDEDQESLDQLLDRLAQIICN